MNSKGKHRLTEKRHSLSESIKTVQRALSAKASTSEVSRVVAGANQLFRKIEENKERFQQLQNAQKKSAYADFVRNQNAEANKAIADESQAPANQHHKITKKIQQLKSRTFSG